MKNYCFFFALSVLSIIVGMMVHPVFYLAFPGIFYFGYQYFGKRYLYSLLLLLIFVLTLRYPRPYTDRIVEGKIIKVDQQRIVVQTKETKVAIGGKFPEVERGGIIRCQVKWDDAKKGNVNAFNYSLYLKSLGITNHGRCMKIEAYQARDNLYLKLKKRIESNKAIKSYAKLFILGIKDPDIEGFYDSLKDLGIVYLFALSGMHINILRKMLRTIFKFFLAPHHQDYLSFGMIGGYLLIIPFNISFTRAYLTMIGNSLFYKYLNKLDVLGLVALIFIWCNPYVIFNLSFIFSFFIYFCLLLVSQSKRMSLFLYLASIPIILSIQYRLNVLTYILGYLLLNYVGYLYRSLVMFVFFGDLVSWLCLGMISLFNNLLILFKDFSFCISFMKPNLGLYLLYYFIFFKMIVRESMGLRWRGELIKLLLVLTVFYGYSAYPLKGEVTMIDVGQGDCFLIRQPYNLGTIMVDTGGLRNSDVAAKVTVPYLRSIGVKQLDYLIISHSDYDHCGAMASLKRLMPVKRTIINNSNFKLGNIEVKAYPYELDTIKENDRSLVFTVKVNGLIYLFLGDAGTAVEKALYEKYRRIPCDVLKVGHHGSKYSSSRYLFLMTDPKIAFISCGKNNAYGHPAKEVLAKFKSNGTKVYQTAVDGMVRIVYYDKYNYLFY